MIRRFSLRYTLFVRLSDMLIVGVAMALSAHLRINVGLGRSGTGEAFATPPLLFAVVGVAWQVAFFGVTSDTPIDWISFTLDNTNAGFDNFTLTAGAAFCLAAVGLLWKRLARAKTAFEQDVVVNDALDNPHWAAFTAAAAAQQGSSSAKNKAANGVVFTNKVDTAAIRDVPS